MSLTELLQKLSEIEPADCQKTGHYYGIGEYVFKPSNDGIVAYCDNGDLGPASGPPALAWLRDAVERAIEARGWDLDMRLSPKTELDTDYININHRTYPFPNSDDKTIALLAAFVAACEAAAPANR